VRFMQYRKYACCHYPASTAFIFLCVSQVSRKG
jgi:hypothetical protein